MSTSQTIHSMPTLNQTYWEERYHSGETAWDASSTSPPLLSYLEPIKDKNLRILIPGCGNAQEARILLDLGFVNFSLKDMAQFPHDQFPEKNPASVMYGPPFGAISGTISIPFYY